MYILTEGDLRHFTTRFKPIREAFSLTLEEKEDLDNLRNNNYTVIKPADKGSAGVILDRTEYLWEGYRQLNDTNYYRKLHKPIYSHTIPMIKQMFQSKLSMQNRRPI